ncbi:MAG: PhoU domain-containing protein [Halovenus sp.]
MNDNETPVERKVQLTGGSTYTVSLPKDWAGRQNIEPGCLVNLYSRGEQLVMTRSGCGPAEERHTSTIQAGDEDPATLALSIGSAYIAGCEQIHVEEIRTTDQRRALVRTIRDFVGLEVITEDETSLVAQTMLDVGDLSPEQTLAQLERTALEMHERAVEAVVDADREVGTRTARQDDDVDRLFALVSRGFQQSLVDPAVTMGNDDDLTPFEYYMAARQLERIGDHAEKIATTASRLAGPPPADIGNELGTFGRRARTVVQQALSGLLDNPEELGSVIADAERLLDDIEAMDERLYGEGLEDGYLLGLVLDSIERTTQYGVNVAEAGLQTQHRTGG